MKVRKWLDKYVWTVAAIFTIVTVLVTAIGLYIDSSRDIDEQIQTVYKKEQLIRQDFGNAYELSGVTCYINEDNNVITIKETDCYLKVTYDKNGEVLTKVFEDTRISTDILACIALGVAMALLGCFVSVGVCALLDYFLSKAESRKISKKKLVDTEDISETI